VDLPSSFVGDVGGAFTRQGTPRLGVLAAARGAFLQRKFDSADTAPLQFDSGHVAPHEDGTFIKSIQGFAEDAWRRIYKRPIPEGDPLDDDEFSRFYRRVQKSVQRSGHLEDRGPAVQDPNKKVRDAHGKRWSLSDELHEAQSGRESADPPEAIRCTGPEPEPGTADVWTRVERRVAREEKMHTEFTHARTARHLDADSWRWREAEGRRYERRHAREGTEAARHVSVGRWREEAVGRADRRGQAVRVPWPVAELDADTWEENARHGATILRRLEERGADLSSVLVAYSGNKSLHIRIPDGMLGCRIYRDTDTARRRIEAFFRRLLKDDPEVIDALDFGVCSPQRTIRAVGSVHPKTGRQTVACTADTFLEKPPCFLRGLSEGEYTPPEGYPLPRRATFCEALSALLDPVPNGPENGRSNGPKTGGAKSECLTHGFNVSCLDCGDDVLALLRPPVDGVSEGRRNETAFSMAHRLVTTKDGQREAWQALKWWNRRNDPPLDEKELRTVFESVARFRVGMVNLEDGKGQGRAPPGGGGGRRVYTVWGDTYPHRKALKDAGFWWDPEAEVWRTHNPVAYRKVGKEIGVIPAGRDSGRIPSPE